MTKDKQQPYLNLLHSIFIKGLCLFIALIITPFIWLHGKARTLLGDS